MNSSLIDSIGSLPELLALSKEKSNLKSVNNRFLRDFSVGELKSLVKSAPKGPMAQNLLKSFATSPTFRGARMLRRLLATFCRISGVHGALVVDSEMSPTATFLDPELGVEDATGGLLEVIRESGRLASEANIGRLEQLWMESVSGHIIVAPLAGGHTLVVASGGESNIGRLRHEVRARTPVIEDLLR